jgi:ATP synthase protein I
VEFEPQGPSCARFRLASASMSGMLARNHRLVVRIVLLQAGCALVAASLFLVLKGASAGVAALAGGVIVAIGSAVFGWCAFKPGVAGAATLGAAMFTGKALQWLWLLLALYVALARARLDAGPLLIGMVAAQLGYWVGLTRFK